MTIHGETKTVFNSKNETIQHELHFSIKKYGRNSGFLRLPDHLCLEVYSKTICSYFVCGDKAQLNFFIVEVFLKRIEHIGCQFNRHKASMFVYPVNMDTGYPIPGCLSMKKSN